MGGVCHFVLHGRAWRFKSRPVGATAPHPEGTRPLQGQDDVPLFTAPPLVREGGGYPLGAAAGPLGAVSTAGSLLQNKVAHPRRAAQLLGWSACYAMARSSIHQQ